HFYLKVDTLADQCPQKWLDRELDESYVNEIIEDLTRAPTTTKNQQPWVGIADIDKNISKSAIKGSRITVVGGRHRHAAYKKVSRVSKLHALELEKVWIAVYDCDLRDEQVRCLAARHNNANRGSMATNFMTRVHSCREWLYQMAGKSDVTDETPKSSQKWKQECQKMYVPTDKDGNTLEPTLQAALLSREVYTEFKKVGDLFKAGKIKDQKTKKSKKGKGLKSEITQNQLGMPLQGLSDETKLALLKEVTTTTISLKEMKSKCDRIKKKQFIVAAFLRHTGEVNFKSIKERFPLHTTEEKLAQFSQSAITKTKTPEVSV
ncbi:hypothetical protein QZH41_017252, partial [Actinostola sp. cb2023]